MTEILAVLGGFFVVLILASLLAIAVDELKARRSWRGEMDECMALLAGRVYSLELAQPPDDADDKEGH